MFKKITVLLICLLLMSTPIYAAPDKDATDFSKLQNHMDSLNIDQQTQKKLIENY